MKKSWSDLEPLKKLKTGYLRGYLFCPECGKRGEVNDFLTMLSVDKEWEEENPIMCPNCKDIFDMPLTIGWAGIKKGKRDDFFNELIKSLEKGGGNK